MAIQSKILIFLSVISGVRQLMVKKGELIQVRALETPAMNLTSWG